jgi:hypothetical protein
MADRFSGEITLGGKIARERLERCKELLCGCLESEMDDTGQGLFNECVSNDFEELVKYCLSNDIALCIQWYQKYEYGAQIQFWVDGKHKCFATNTEDEIVVALEELQSNSELTVADFISQLDIPEFPDLEIVEFK